MPVVDSQSTLTIEQREVFLVEYQAAQDSAQHHDNLVWTITSLNWVGSAVLIGFVLGKIDDASPLLAKYSLLPITFVGMALTGCVWLWAYQMRGVKLAKYMRCQALERILGMEQHSKLTYKASSQTKTYGLLMALFLLVWALLLVIIIFG